MIILGFGYDKEGYDKYGYDRNGYDREGYDCDGYNIWGYDHDGFNRRGLDRDGRDREGYNQRGYDRQGFNRDGYDRWGYDKDGFNKEGYDKKGFGRDGYNKDGFDCNGFGKDGYDRRGFDKRGYNKEGYDKKGFNKRGFNAAGYDKYGFDKKGYDKKGFGRDGFNKEGFDKKGFGRDGFNKRGLDRDGYDRDGYNRKGYDRDGYNREGYDCDGFNRDGFNRDGFDLQGYNCDGYDKDGFDKEGRDKGGYDREGFDAEGFNRSGFDQDGFDRCGFGKDGFNARGFDSNGVHQNGSLFDQDGYDRNGFDTNGLDRDGYNENGLKHAELALVSDQGNSEPDNETIAPKIRRAILMCEDGDFQKAHELIESALNEMPEDANAYVAALMVEKRVRFEYQLSYANAFDFSDIEESPNYKKAIRFGSQRIKDRLSAYALRNKELTHDWILLDTDDVNGRQLVLSRYITSGRGYMANERERQMRTDDMSSIPGNYITWEDSSAREWLNGAYLESLPRFIRERVVETEIHTNGTSRDWYYLPDSWQVPPCTTWDRVFLLSVEEVERYFWEESSRVAEYKDSGYASTWNLRSPGFYVVNPWYDIGWNNMVDGNRVYCYGTVTVSNGMWGSALGRTLGCFAVDRYPGGSSHRPAMWLDGDVDPSDPRAESWFPDFTVSYVEDIVQGATRNISFGGKLWRVLEVADGAALLITENAISLGSYTGKTIDEITANPSISWSGSPIRAWLNSGFLSELGENCVSRILTKKNATQDSTFVRGTDDFDEDYLERHSRYDPEITEEKVFLLDAFEAIKYFADADDRVCNYMGIPIWWHLRSFCREVDSYAYKVSEDGGVSLKWGGTAVAIFGIRPAMWIRL